ncbi:MAG: YihY/virulence factor BrkB family protein [Anaerotignaceae bacterium]
MKLTDLQPVQFLIRLIKRYFNDDIGSSAAALSYYMVFSFFPLIILGSMLLGYANISSDSVSQAFSGILPHDVINIINRYLIYVSTNKNANILMVSLFFTVYFPLRAVKRIMDEINRVYKVQNERRFLKKILFVLMFTTLFVFTIFASLTLLIAGRTILSFISKFVGISSEFIDAWVINRFAAMAIICFFTITILYILAPNCSVSFTQAFPGAGAAVFLWLLLSAGFSYYVENMGNYSVLFGSIGAIIVLLVWLYMMASILLMGAEVNSVLKEMNEEKNKKTRFL